MNHQARRMATKPRLTKETRRRIRAYIAERDGRLCHYCRRPFTDLYGVTLDHYVPHSLWAMNKPRNLVLACVACNQRKADALPVALAFTLLARTAAAFTVDPQVLITWARTGSATRVGRPVATPGGHGFSVAFTLTVNAFNNPPRRAGSTPRRARVGCRATVPLDAIGRPLTWKGRPIHRHLNTRLNTVNTRAVAPSIGSTHTRRIGMESTRLHAVVNTPLDTVNSRVDAVNRWGAAA